MSSLTSLIVLLIFISALPHVSSNYCTDCCDYGSCSHAYDGSPGHCCGFGSDRFCCPSGYTCGSNIDCRRTESSGGIFGTVIACIVVIIIILVLIGYCCCCPNELATNQSTYEAPVHYNHGACSYQHSGHRADKHVSPAPNYVPGYRA